MKKMSKILVSFTFIFCGILTTKAQDVRYDVLTDDASEIKHVVNFNLFDIDMSLYNFPGSSLNLSVWGHNQLFPKFFLEYKIRVGYVSWARRIDKVDKKHGLVPLQNYEVGANYDFFMSSPKSKNYKMVLGSRRFGNYTQTTYFYAPGATRTKIGARAGFKIDVNQYRLNNGTWKGFVQKTSGPQENNYFNHFGFGFYAGISFKKLRNVIIDVEGYGLRSNSLRQNWIIDMLIMPVNTFKNKTVGNATQDVKNFQKKNLPIGFRIGYEIQNTALRKEGGKLLPESSQFFIGYRPYDGWFFQYGVGWSLWRKK